MNSSKLFVRKGIFVAVSILALGASGAALAAEATNNLAVSADVSNNCTISTSPVAFGAYDPIVANASSALEGAGSVSVTCTSGALTTVRLGQGANADGGTAAAPARRMTDGTNFLGYSLHSDAGRAAIWGDDATVDVEHTGTGTEAVLSVYGSVASGQNVPAGTYNDTVVATITF